MHRYQAIISPPAQLTKQPCVCLAHVCTCNAYPPVVPHPFPKLGVDIGRWRAVASLITRVLVACCSVRVIALRIAYYPVIYACIYPPFLYLGEAMAFHLRVMLDHVMIW